MNVSKGRHLHKQALDAQEDGNFEEALKLIDSALIAYSEDQDKAGFAEAHAMRYLTLNHLYMTTGFKGWLMSAKFTVEAGVELAKEIGDEKTLGITLFHLGESLEDLGRLEDALKNYRECLMYLADQANIENVKNHMEVCAYKNGDKQAIDRAIDAVNRMVEIATDSEYNHQAWISGGYLRISQALKDDDKEKAKEYLKKAKDYVDTHPDLKIRREQIEKLDVVLND